MIKSERRVTISGGQFCSSIPFLSALQHQVSFATCDNIGLHSWKNVTFILVENKQNAGGSASSVEWQEEEQSNCDKTCGLSFVQINFWSEGGFKALLLLMAGDRKLNQTVEKFWIRNARCFPQFRIHADRREAWDRIDLIKVNFIGSFCNKEVHASHA